MSNVNVPYTPPVSVLADVEAKMFQSVDVEIEFLDKVLGGIPTNENALEYYIETKFTSDAEKADFRARLKDGTLTKDEIKEKTDSSTCRFEYDKDGHLSVWNGNLKAMLREGFTTLDIPSMVKVAGGYKNAAKQQWQHGLVIDPLYVKFLVDGKPVTKPTGAMDKIKHLKDPITGMDRSALGRHDYMGAGTRMKFSIKWLRKSCITVDHAKELLCLAQNDGCGASRSQSHGRFVVVSFQHNK